jgi:hypothetical protein
VRAAQAIADPALRAAALLSLVQRALTGTGIQVGAAGNSSPTRVHPNDYQAVPALNFDVRLNDKRSWPATQGGPTRPLTQNYGYSFERSGTVYAILGPLALNLDSPLFTRMYAEHELYHTQHHLGPTAGTPASRDDEELETWTRDFRNYFHQLHRFRMQWAPLIGYYEGATQAARQRALGQLVSYYNTPPVPAAEVAAVQRAFAQWLRRRLADPGHTTKALIQDLESRLHLGTP